MNGDSLLLRSILKWGHGAGAPGPDTCIIHRCPTGAEEEAQIFGTGDTTGGERGPWTGAPDDSLLLQPALLLPICMAAAQANARLFHKELFLLHVLRPHMLPHGGQRRTMIGVVFGWSPAQGSPNLTLILKWAH